MPLDPMTVPRMMIAPDGRLVPDGLADLVRRIEDNERDTMMQIAAIAPAFNTTVAELQAKQAQLDAQLASITTLVAQQVTGDTGNATAGPVSVSTSGGDYAVITFTVPSGYTKASVMAVSSAVGGGSAILNLNTRIAGADGLVLQVYAGGAYQPGSSAYARTLTGLTGGGTFQVASHASSSTGTLTTYFITAAVVTYYR